MSKKIYTQIKCPVMYAYFAASNCTADLMLEHMHLARIERASDRHASHRHISRQTAHSTDTSHSHTLLTRLHTAHHTSRLHVTKSRVDHRFLAKTQGHRVEHGWFDWLQLLCTIGCTGNRINSYIFQHLFLFLLALFKCNIGRHLGMHMLPGHPRVGQPVVCGECQSSNHHHDQPTNHHAVSVVMLFLFLALGVHALCVFVIERLFLIPTGIVLFIIGCNITNHFQCSSRACGLLRIRSLSGRRGRR